VEKEKRSDEYDRFSWKAGDCLIHKNEKEAEKAMAAEGYEYFIEPGKKPRRLKKEKEGE